MTTTVYLIRHAEAEGNVYRRCHGQYDSLLSPRAYEQLPHLTKRFAHVPLDAVFSSDLFRARKTAQAIADAKHLPVEIRAALREIDMGDWEDKCWAELPLTDPAAYALWQHRPWQAHPPGGESVIEAGTRMFAGVQQLVREREGQQLAVVTHGLAIRGALTIAHGWQPCDMPRLGFGDNTCVAKLEFASPDEVSVVYENDATHLPQQLSTFAAIGWTGSKGTSASPQIWFRAVEPDHAADADALVAFFREIYHNAYDIDRSIDAATLLSNIRRMLTISPRAVTFGIGSDGQPVALVCINTLWPDEPTVGMVGGICIAERYRGIGLSQQILGQAISVCRSLGREWLCVHVSVRNERAKKFYQKHGFELRGHYQNENGNHDRMWKRIAIEPVSLP